MSPALQGLIAKFKQTKKTRNNSSWNTLGHGMKSPNQEFSSQNWTVLHHQTRPWIEKDKYRKQCAFVFLTLCAREVSCTHSRRLADHSRSYVLSL